MSKTRTSSTSFQKKLILIVMSSSVGRILIISHSRL